MKVLLIDEPHKYLIDYLRDRGISLVFDYSSTAEELAERIHEFSGIVLRSRISIDQSFLEKANNLKFIAREGVGLEHIDIHWAARKGIEVLTSPEASRDAVGEHAVGMILSLLNKISIAHGQVRESKWVRATNRGVELRDKTVGIMGYGNMGSSLAKKLSGFNCRIISFDRYKKNYADAYTEEVDLETLQYESDIISLHFPYSLANHFYVDAEFIATVHKPFYLINTARGLVLKTSDLVVALKSGKVLGAALDVLEYEDVSFDNFRIQDGPEDLHYLCASDNVLMTPHIAGWTFESKRKHAEVLANKITKLLSL